MPRGCLCYASKPYHVRSDRTKPLLSTMGQMAHAKCTEPTSCNLFTPRVPFTSRAHSSFFYGPSNISAIRNSALLHLRHCSTFEVLTACLWSCRTIALQPNPNDEMRIVCIVNARNIFNPPLARGYHGNSTAQSVAMAPAGEISRNYLGFTLEFDLKCTCMRSSL